MEISPTYNNERNENGCKSNIFNDSVFFYNISFF